MPEAKRGPSTPDAVEIEHRLIYPMIDEAALCLSEGVVGSAPELDLAMIAGTGFPPFRGGLLRHADAAGCAGIVAGLDRLARTAGARFAPSIALRAVGAAEGFYARFPGEGRAGLARRTDPAISPPADRLPPSAGVSDSRRSEVP